VAAQGKVTAFLLQTIGNTMFCIALASQVQQKHMEQNMPAQVLQLLVNLKFKEIIVIIL